MESIQLSQKVLDICKRNYDSNCGNCEIRDACTANVAYGLQELNEYTTNVNNMAKRVNR